jgi:hypothetical protein
VLSLIVGLLLVVPAGRPFAEERLLLDRRLETLRRILPDGPVASADILHLRQLAEAAQLGRIEVVAGSSAQNGTSGEATYELTALGGYDEIARFFGQAALSHRLIDVESLTLASAPERVIQISSTLRLPFWPPGGRLPPPPESRRRISGVPRPTLEAYYRDQSLALAKSQAIESWRRARRNPRLFLSELAAVVRERPVMLGYASIDEVFTVRGLAVGEGTVQGLESRFERGFFRISDFLMAKQGACHRFEVHGTSPVAGPDVELTVPFADPFAQDDTPCRVDRDPPSRVVVAGPTPTAKKPGNGPLTLRLRAVDFADVFQALGLVSGTGFIVDADVTGRVSLDVTRMTLGETLALLRRKAKIAIEGSGRVRRVSRVGAPPRTSEPAGGDPVSFSLKRADVRELLAVMTDIDPALATLGPPGFLGRLSVWASGVPLLATGSAQPPVPVAGSATERRLRLRPEDLAVLEFEVAGVASNGAGWLVFAYSPTGQLHAYRPGDRLFDAIVRSIQSTDVVLETSEGPLRLALPPM